jgi:hypothetical protein
MITYEEAGWVDSVLMSMAQAIIVEAPMLRRGQLLVSVATNRRASVLWVVDGKVCVEWAPNCTTTMTIEVCLRLYTPIQ